MCWQAAVHGLGLEQSLFLPEACIPKLRNSLLEGKEGTKNKIVDSFKKRAEWDFQAPLTLVIPKMGKTFITKAQGPKIASKGLKSWVPEISLGPQERGGDLFAKLKWLPKESSLHRPHTE